MPDPRPEPMKSLFQRSWLRRTLLALAALLVLFTALLLALPPVVSSDWARARLEQGLATASGKPASLRLLSFGWSDGLRLEGLLVGRGGLEDEAFLCSLERLHVGLALLPALRKDLRLEVQLSGLRLRYRLDPGAAEPEPAAAARPLPALLKDSLAALRKGLRPGPRQGDLQASVDLSDIAVRLDLAAGNSTLDLKDVGLRLDAPGLGNGPLRLDAGLKILLDGRELAPLKVEASLDNLLDAAGLLAPAQARLAARAEAPGLHLAAQGSVASGFKADLRLDLGQAAPLIKPFARASLPEATGSLALGLTLSQPDPDHLAVGLVAFADALRAVGGPLGARAVGPLKLQLLQEAYCDLAAGTLRAPGSLSLLNKSAVGWKGEITGLNQGAPTVSLNIQPLHLQLDELFAIARAWLLPGLGIGTASVDAASIGILATLPDQPDQPDQSDKPGQKPRLEASIKGLSIEGRNITRVPGPQAKGKERLSLARAVLRLDSAQAELPGNAPGRLEAHAQVELEGLRLQGASPLNVQRATLSRLDLKAETLAQDPLALFGVRATASLDMVGAVQGLDVPGQAQAPALTQSLALRAELPSAKTALARLESLRVDIPQLRLLQPGKRPLETPLALRLTAPDIRLGGSPTGITQISEAALALDIGPTMHCAASGSLAGGDLRSQGSLSLDLQKLLALAAPLLPPQAKGSGRANLDWKLAAALPQQKADAPKPEKLSQQLARLGALKELEAVLKLSEVSLDWPLAKAKANAKGDQAETLRLRGLSTPRPLHMTSTAGMRESSLEGSLAFGPLAELPGAGRLARPLRGLLTLSASQQNLRSLQVAQVLHLDGLDLDQSLRLSLDRLDQVLDRDQDRLAAILEHVDGTLGFDLKAKLQPSPSKEAVAHLRENFGIVLQSTPAKDGTGLSGKGRLDAGFDARLSGGRSLALSARLLSPGLDLNLGPELAISGLTSSLRLDKRYALSPGLRCAAPANSVRPPLSEQVFNLFPAATGSGGNGGSDGSARASLHEFQAGGGSLGFSRLQLKSGALPLALHDVSFRLDTGGALPALRSFRAGLLGGDIQGSAVVKAGDDAGRGNYSLEADLAFTGIDPSRLFPAKAAKDLGGQAETAGRVTLSLPLTPDPETLLQRLGLRADITRIGPRTLERMLYALDPDEQNETIVQQRRLMDLGYPRFVRLGLAYGNLSLSGELEVKGFRLELPRIDRLPVGNLPVRRQLTKALAPVHRAVTILDAVSAGSICRDPAGPPGALMVTGNTAQEGVAP